MPVFQAMAPVVHAQYSGGGGGTGALANAGIPSGGVRDPAQLNQEPNPILSDEYEQALLRAMKMAGLNPSSLNPNVTKVMQKGKQLVNELILAMSPGRGGNPALASSAPDMLNMLAGLIRQAISGGKVFGGSEKESGLSGLMGLVNQGATGSTGSVGGDLLAQMLASPTTASNLFSEARYGNLADPFQRLGQHALLGLLDNFYQQQQANPAGMPNFLATLLGGQSGATSSLGAGSSLPSGLGAGANPAAAPNPAAAAAGLTPGAGAGTGGGFPGYGLGGAPQSFLPPPNPVAAAAGLPTGQGQGGLGLDPTQQLLALAQGGQNPYLGY